MKQIKLSQGKFALVDDEDYDSLSENKWCAIRAYDGKRVYSMRTQTKPIRKVILMHREILSPPSGLMVDHVDGDGLNNQRSNLRVCTNAENQWNRGKSVFNSTGFKGVTYHKRSGVYQAQIRYMGKSIYIGSFETPEEAAEAYDNYAVNLHGDFSVTNFGAWKLK